MNLLIPSLLIILITVNTKYSTAIFGGSIANATEFPAYVSFLAIDGWNRNSSIANMCGGTLIGERWVVTARHCRAAFDKTIPSPYKDVSPLYSVGVSFNNNGIFTKKIAVDEVFICPDEEYPPDYNGSYPSGFKPYVDCALVKLEEDATLYGAKVAPLFRGEKPFDKVKLVGMGSFGSCTDCRVSTLLREVTTVVTEDINCEPPDVKYGIYNGTRSICAGEAKFKKRAGAGDSGGPLFTLNGEYLGTLNGGVGFSDEPPFERNFTRALYSDFIADWIEQTIGEDEKVFISSEDEGEGTSSSTGITSSALVRFFLQAGLVFLAFIK